MKLRSLELVLPGAAEAADFMTGVWGMALADAHEGKHYLRGSGTFPYLLALEQGDKPYARSTTFVCSRPELDALAHRVANSGLSHSATKSEDLGGGYGIIVELPEGELFRFLADTTEVAPLPVGELPVKLAHVVVNSIDAEASARVAEAALGFKVSDRTKGMVFVRCNNSHHSTAFARAGFASLNHVAFEMESLDAVMRGIGRLRDHKYTPAWGPGRHGPGDNAFAYFIAPFGAVVEFSTAVEEVPDDHHVGEPADWAWPANRIDQWGMSDKDVATLRRAEETFRFGNNTK